MDTAGPLTFGLAARFLQAFCASSLSPPYKWSATPSMHDGAHGSHSICKVDTQANQLARFVGNRALYALHAFQRPFLRRHLATVVLVTLYLCAGMIGHDPWKQDEAYTFGMVLHILQSGDWVVPTLGGEPFMEKPPLFYLVAALMAWLWSPWLPLHDGARLAALAFMAIGVLMTGLAARRLYGDAAMPRAVLLLLACSGLLQHAHEMITDTARSVASLYRSGGNGAPANVNGTSSRVV